MTDNSKVGETAADGGWTDRDPATIYPAEHHFRIVVAEPFAGEEALRQVLAGYAVTAPLAAGGTSRQGRYRTLSVSVRVGGREELVQLDRALRAVTGVRLLL